eukprot:TRINITY_DN1481_c0_g1_i12.p1 TRINITY_DN1481_c0_g1~~TRINITY_DN1481_c0_g1_i12.p1  ORF type:complete len:149 (-),score=21.71 TRINITY_DN1481_c0_g1_i12:286-732(-)
MCLVYVVNAEAKDREIRIAEKRVAQQEALQERTGGAVCDYHALHQGHIERWTKQKITDQLRLRNNIISQIGWPQRLLDQAQTAFEYLRLTKPGDKTKLRISFDKKDKAVVCLKTLLRCEESCQFVWDTLPSALPSIDPDSSMVSKKTQ